MSRRGTLTGAAVAALVAFAAVLAWVLTPAGPGGQGYRALVGGPFTLATHDGARLSDADLKGKPFAIFFGFTRCPDVCPTSMVELTNLIADLGPEADRMRYLFVTLDPERDTAEHLRTYLSSFDPRIIGLVGTPEETAAIAKAYRVYYERVPTEGGDYTLNHTATVYLMDAQGQFAATLAFDEDEASKRAKLKRLVGSQS